jgi:hypothetical protein
LSDPLSFPLYLAVFGRTLDACDREKLRDLDARAQDAIAQMGLDDTSTFQACLEARHHSERAELLLQGVRREADRLMRRATLARALKSS